MMLMAQLCKKLLQGTLVVCIALFLNSIDAQKQIDSLESVINNASDADAVVKARLKLLKDVASGDYPLPKIETHVNALLDYAKRNNDKIIEARTKIAMGWIFTFRSQYKKAETLYKEGIETLKRLNLYNSIGYAYNGLIVNGIFKGDFNNTKTYVDLAEANIPLMDDEIRISSTFLNLGVFYEKYSGQEKSLEMHFEGLKWAMKCKSKSLQSRAYNNIGAVYDFTGSHDRALEYYFKKIELDEDIGKNSSTTYFNIGGIYFYQNNFQKSITYLNESIHRSKKVQRKDNIVLAYTLLGKIYTSQNDLEKARLVYNNAHDYAIQLNNNAFIISTHLNLKYLDYLQHGNRIPKRFIQSTITQFEAIEYYQDMFADCLLLLMDYYKRRNNNKAIIELIPYFENTDFEESKKIDFYNYVYKAYETTGNESMAFAYHKKLRDLELKLEKTKNIERMTTLNLEYEFNKEREKIHLENEKQKIIQDEQINAQRQKAKLFAIGGILMIIVSFVIYYFYNTAKKTNLELKQQQQILNRFNNTNLKLLSIIGHDFKSPITSFRFLVQLLANTDLTKDEASEYLNQIKTEINTLEGSIENTVDWANKQINVIKTNVEQLSLKATVDYSIESLKEFLLLKGIEVKASLNDELTIFADRNQLIIILRNIINNAIKFSHRDSKILVYALDSDKTCKLVIEDTGIGISKAHIEKLLSDHYTSESNKGTEGESGTGLGISIVKDFLKKINASLDIESEMNKGTKMILTFQKATHKNSVFTAAS